MILRNKMHRQEGFSLVEVMVAMAIFTVAAIGLASLSNVSMEAASHGARRTSADNLAQYAMTWIQNEAAAYLEGESEATYTLVHNGITNKGTWILLDGTQPTYRLDEYLGNSLMNHYTADANADTVPYCVEYMVGQYNSGDFQDTDGFIPDLLTASVRVTWPKRGYYSANWKNCGTRKNNPNNFYSVVLTKVLTRDFADRL